MEEFEQELPGEKPANTSTDNGESTDQQSMDSQTLSAVLQFLRKNNLKVSAVVFCCYKSLVYQKWQSPCVNICVRVSDRACNVFVLLSKKSFP